MDYADYGRKQRLMAYDPNDGAQGWAGSAEYNRNDPAQGYSTPAASAGGGVSSAGDAAMMTGNPYAVAAGLGLKAVGTGLDIYGAYKQNERQDDLEAQARAEMDRQRMMQAQDRQRKQHLEDVSMAFNYGDYAGKQDDRLMNQYLDYYRKAGF